MTDVMKRVLLGVRVYPGGPVPIRFYVAPNGTRGERFRDVAIGCFVEILHNDEVVLTDYSWWQGGPDLTRRDFGSWSDPEPVVALRDLDLTSGEWTVHVRGDADLALRAGESIYYWSGEFTMPLPIRMMEANAAEPHWWYDEDEVD